MSAKRYENTPVWPIEGVRAGWTTHIGGGVFASRCDECGGVVMSEPGTSYVPVEKHKRGAHGIAPAPMLPSWTG